MAAVAVQYYRLLMCYICVMPDLVPSALTDNEWEQTLLHADYASEIEPDDPMYVEISALSTRIGHLLTKIPTKQRRVVTYLHAGTFTGKEIADRCGVSATTIAKARQNPLVRRVLALTERVNRLHRGPSEAQRRALLWRIAKREEIDRPAIAIKALDTLNRQEGLYRADSDRVEGVVVNIKNFHVNPTPPADATSRPPPATLEGEFTPVVVSTRD